VFTILFTFYKIMLERGFVKRKIDAGLFRLGAELKICQPVSGESSTYCLAFTENFADGVCDIFQVSL